MAIRAEVDRKTMQSLKSDGYAMCVKCDGGDDHQPAGLKNGTCTACGAKEVFGMDWLLAQGIIRPSRSVRCNTFVNVAEVADGLARIRFTTMFQPLQNGVWQPDDRPAI